MGFYGICVGLNCIGVRLNLRERPTGMSPNELSSDLGDTIGNVFFFFFYRISLDITGTIIADGDVMKDLTTDCIKWQNSRR